MKYSTDKETDLNRMRTEVLLLDRMEGKYQIQISTEVYRSLQELSQRMKESNTPFNDIIKKCVESYRKEMSLGPPVEGNALAAMAENNEEFEFGTEEDT
jgi:predicted CopG family antitoxin